MPAPPAGRQVWHPCLRAVGGCAVKTLTASSSAAYLKIVSCSARVMPISCALPSRARSKSRRSFLGEYVRVREEESGSLLPLPLAPETWLRLGCARCSDLPQSATS